MENEWNSLQSNGKSTGNIVTFMRTRIQITSTRTMNIYIVYWISKENHSVIFSNFPFIFLFRKKIPNRHIQANGTFIWFQLNGSARFDNICSNLNSDGLLFQHKFLSRKISLFQPLARIWILKSEQHKILNNLI